MVFSVWLLWISRWKASSARRAHRRRPGCVRIELIAPITSSPTISGNESAEYTPILATRPPKCGHRLSLPSDPLIVGRPDCIHVMHGPSFRSWYCNLSIALTNSAVATHVWSYGAPSRELTNATPAPSTPGMARAANSATSPSKSTTPRAPATIPATPRRPAYCSAWSAYRCAGESSDFRRFATRLRVVIGHGECRIYSPCDSETP